MDGLKRQFALHVEQLEVDIRLKDSLIDSLTKEATRDKEEIKTLEDELKKSEKLEELEELVVVVKQKNERIEDLEDSLHRSLAVVSDLEMEKRDEEEQKALITEKVSWIKAFQPFCILMSFLFFSWKN